MPGAAISRITALLFIATAFVPHIVAAQTRPAGALADPVLTDRFSEFERRAAFANQATYNALTLPSSKGAAICPPQGAATTCQGAVLEVFNNVRELVQTAEEVLTGTDRPFGLNLDIKGLGAALRWTAPEELLAQGSMSKEFLNNQVSMLGNRMAAVRAASRSNLAGLDVGALIRTGYASTDGVPPGSTAGGWSRLSTFFDAAGSFGDKADSTNIGGFEDAFDFRSHEFTLGLDYRFSDNLVAGGLFGYSGRNVDFDASQSVVAGSIESRGYSLIAFAQWDQMRFYASGSLGYQRLNFDTYRRIMFASLDPDVASINTAVAGSPDSNALLATLDFGVPLEWKSIGVDLYVKADYQHLETGRFSESEAPVTGNSGSGFQFDVAGQTIRSLDTAIGIKLQHVWTPDFGVLVPYVRGEYHRQLENGSHGLSTIYAGLPDDVDAAIRQSLDFALQSDAPDKAFHVLSGGVSAVLRGSSRISAAGVAGGGLQGYLQYATVRGRARYNDNVITGGLRYEF